MINDNSYETITDFNFATKYKTLYF